MRRWYIRALRVLAAALSTAAVWCRRQASPRWYMASTGWFHHGTRLGQPTPAWRDVIRRDPCTYCGVPSETTDHIVPVSAGGLRDWPNEVGACKSCNEAKAATPLLVFLVRRHHWRPKTVGLARKAAAYTKQQKQAAAVAWANRQPSRIGRVRVSGGHR